MDSSGHPTFKYFTNGKELEQWSNFEIKIERKYLYTCFKSMSNNQKIPGMYISGYIVKYW